MKKVNYKMGALKRKFKTGRDDQEPGTFIKLAQVQKEAAQESPKETLKVSIAGLV